MSPEGQSEVEAMKKVWPEHAGGSPATERVVNARGTASAPDGKLGPVVLVQDQDVKATAPRGEGCSDGEKPQNRPGEGSACRATYHT